MLSLQKQNMWRRRYRAMRPGWRPATELYAELVQEQLRPFTRLLDLGCGRGGLIEQLSLNGACAIGVDPDWRSLREHRLPLPRVVAGGDHLPFAPQTFHLVFASWVLEHLAAPLHTFRAVRRILRPGGAFIFITPNGRHPLTWANRLVGRFARLQQRVVSYLYGRAGADTFPTTYRANSRAALESLCQQSGLVLHTLHHVPDPTYLAFTPTLFHLMRRVEEALPAERKVHLVGVARRSSE